MPQIYKRFKLLCAEYKGIQAVQLIVPCVLNNAQIIEFTVKLEKRFKRTIKLECVVDPSILGGFIATAGHFRIDGSVKNQLTRLVETLTA